jgi:iron-sulfur cluster repair protein YtfE (RIC family)
VNVNFSRKTKVNDIVLSNPRSQQTLEEAGLDYCCGGRKAFDEADASPDEILNPLWEKQKRHS